MAKKGKKEKDLLKSVQNSLMWMDIFFAILGVLSVAAFGWFLIELANKL